MLGNNRMKVVTVLLLLTVGVVAGCNKESRVDEDA